MRRVLLVALLGCGGSSSGCGSSGDCGEDEVQVVYLRGDRDGDVVCKPKPASCGATASCGVQECIREMYGYCESPYIGVGCSDTFRPPIISCNP